MIHLTIRFRFKVLSRVLVYQLRPERFTAKAEIHNPLLKEDPSRFELKACADIKGAQGRGVTLRHFILDPSFQVIDMHFSSERVASIAIFKLHE